VTEMTERKWKNRIKPSETAFGYRDKASYARLGGHRFSYLRGTRVKEVVV